MHLKKFLKWLYSFSSLLQSPEVPCVFLPDGIQGTAESMLHFRSFDVNHFLLGDPEYTIHTHYTMKHNKCQ